MFTPSTCEEKRHITSERTGMLEVARLKVSVIDAHQSEHSKSIEDG